MLSLAASLKNGSNSMIYWEIIADKLSAARLVVGLLQRRYTRWLALDC
jgi:hypothetical protein